MGFFLLLIAFNFILFDMFIKLSNSNNLYKNISSRDIHIRNVPNLGGVVFFMWFFQLFFLYKFSFFGFLNLDLSKIILPEYVNFLIFSALFFFIVGLIDDLYNISYIIKFIAQIIIAFFLIQFFDVHLKSFYGIFNLFEVNDLILKFFSTLLFVFIINSYNLIDGVDGLAAFVGIFVFSIFSAIFYFNLFYFDLFLSISAIIILLIFLFFNYQPARLFMGDSGSMLIGFILSYLTLKVCNLPINSYNKINPVFIMCVLAYPLIDTLRVFCLRIYNNKSPFSADRNHIHHLLIDKKISHSCVCFFAILYSLILTCICYFFIDFPNISFFVMVFLAILFVFILTNTFIKNTIKKIF